MADVARCLDGTQASAQSLSGGHRALGSGAAAEEFQGVAAVRLRTKDPSQQGGGGAREVKAASKLIVPPLSPLLPPQQLPLLLLLLRFRSRMLLDGIRLWLFSADQLRVDRERRSLSTSLTDRQRSLEAARRCATHWRQKVARRKVKKSVAVFPTLFDLPW